MNGAAPPPYLGLKDLARTMGVSMRTVKRWYQRLEVPPTVPGHACHRWSPQDARRLLKRWEKANKQAYERRSDIP